MNEFLSQWLLAMIAMVNLPGFALIVPLGTSCAPGRLDRI